MKNAKTSLLGVTLALTSSVLLGCSRNSDTAPDKALAPTSAPGASALIKNDYKPGEITSLCDGAIATLETRLKAITTLPFAERNMNSTVLAFEVAIADFGDVTNNLTFMGYVSTDENLREEGFACEEKVGQLFVDLFTRRPLYDALKAAKSRNAEEARLYAETLKSFEKNGLELSDAKLAEVKSLLGELSKKETKFSANLNGDTTKLEFAPSQLEGVPADALSRWEKTVDGNFVLSTKSTDYVAVVENAVDSEARRKMMLAYLNRGTLENTKLLEEATGLRAKIAQALGYSTWADYKTSDRMAQNKATALDFLEGLKGKLAVRNRADLQQLLKLKKEEIPTATRLEQWDIPYYTAKLKKRDYSIDDEIIREFFPADQVVKGMFEVYSKLLGVKYKEVAGADVWHESVKLFEIRDSKSDELIGHFYADFFPRDGKYSHAAAFTLVSGRKIGSAYNTTVSSIVANFTPPTGGKPSLLTHDEVETVFHEFGHIMHQTLTRAPYASLSGTAVARDFVEAPSQIFENWVWNPEILNLISGHYLDPNKKLPADLLEKMLEAKNFGQGMFYTKQLLYGLFDMTIHSQTGAVDVTKTYDDLYREIIGEEPIAGGHFPQTFGHMMGGYDAGYYGYLWSEVYAADMFSIFAEKGLLDEATGMKYRETILEKGGMNEAIDLLRSFLGREPNSDAFFKKLGL